MDRTLCILLGEELRKNEEKTLKKIQLKKSLIEIIVLAKMIQCVTLMHLYVPYSHSNKIKVTLCAGIHVSCR